MWRRNFLQLAGYSALAACGSPSAASRAAAASPGAVRAVGFDLFTVFDPRGVDHRVAEVVPDQPAAFAATWKTRLFEYNWIRAAAGQYVAFDRLVDDALDFAARSHRIELAAPARAHLAAAFTELAPWPDRGGLLLYLGVL
jgi:2-haloacid dehalogenase